MDVNIKNPLLEFLPNAVVSIRKIYNLDNGRMAQSVDILEEWVKKQKHFLNKSFNRHYLELSIIACKGSVEKAKNQIDKLCTYKTLFPKFFISSGVKNICEEINDIGQTIVLPKMTKEYQRVCISKIDDQKLKSSHYLSYYKHTIIISEYLKSHDYVDGLVIIDDLRNVNLIDLTTEMNFIEYQQFMTIIAEGFGARIKGIHIISQSKMVDMFVKIVKSMLSSKLANRIYVHPEIENLHQVIEKEILPVDYGGEERSIKELQAEWTILISSEENEKYLEVTKASATDESQRQTDKFNELYMGLPGSFRTLIVD